MGNKTEIYLVDTYISQNKLGFIRMHALLKNACHYYFNQ
jgi:hypothetical protein